MRSSVMMVKLQYCRLLPLGHMRSNDYHRQQKYLSDNFLLSSLVDNVDESLAAPTYHNKKDISKDD